MTEKKMIELIADLNERMEMLVAVLERLEELKRVELERRFGVL